MKQYVIGAIALLVGASMTIKTDAYLRNLGRMQWAEEKLSGGSRLGYKIIGLALVIMGLLAITGQFNSLAGGLLTKMFVN